MLLTETFALGYIDLHSHVLPGLDDGAPDLPSSLAMLQGLEELGFERVCATPHQKASQFLPSLEEIDSAYQTVVNALASSGISLALSLGAENFWDDVFFERQKVGDFPRYDGGKAFLFEIHPSEIPARFENVLFHLRTKGYLPVMAHPERYAGLVHDLDRLAQIGQSVPLVVDLGAVAGHHGFGAKRCARRLLKEGIAHAAASDVHQPADVKSAAEGIHWIQKRLGPSAAKTLLSENPRRILAGEAP